MTGIPDTSVPLISDAGAAPPAEPAAPTTGIQNGGTASDVSGAAPLGTPAELSITTPDLPPIEYGDFNFPQGFEKDDTILSQFTEVAKGLRMPQDKAQALIDLGTKLQTNFAEKGMETWLNTNKEWESQVKADPEIGGQNIDKTISTVAKSIDMYGGKEAQALRDAFDITGAGNNPFIVKYLYRMASQLTEGGPINGAPSRGVARDPAKTLYPNQP